MSPPELSEDQKGSGMDIEPSEFSEHQNESGRDIEPGMTFLLDLNHPPPNYNEGTFTTASALVPGEQATHDGNVNDDDVILSSPRSFFEARKNSRRCPEVIIVPDDDDDAEAQGDLEFEYHYNEPRSDQQSKTNISLDLHLDMEQSLKTKSDIIQVAPELLPLKPATFKCPICLDQVTDEMSTKCGHIFCQECIMGAIVYQKKCPTCRKKLTKKGVRRIYLQLLPSTIQMKPSHSHNKD